MDDIEKLLNPPQRLAIAYAPLQFRDAFALLLQVDARFAELVAKSSEPLIGQMKLAWWRDAIAAEPDRRPKGEPLFERLGATSGLSLAPSLTMLVDAWESLLVDPTGEGGRADFAKARSAAIFGSYANWVGSQDDLRLLGEEWALVDVFGVSAVVHPEKIECPRVRALRPLSILAMSVRGVSGPRLIWHALTGR
jgi:phytoene synthase